MTGLFSALRAMMLISIVLSLALPQPATAGNTPAHLDPASVSSRIVGGAPVTDPDRYPWMTALVDAGNEDLFSAQSCGGTLLSPGWVLSAAHCFWDEEQEILMTEFDAVLGTISLEAAPGSYERIAIRNIIMHPDYDPLTDQNDIAMLRLASPSAQPPIDFLAANFSDAAPGQLARAIGWGGLEAQPGEEEPDVEQRFPVQLQQVDLPLVSNEDCAASLETPITERSLCAGFPEGQRDTCQGDSGGPLFLPLEPGDMLVGIVSFGEGCAQPNSFGAYTRVSEFRDWISGHYQECFFDALEDYPDLFAPSGGETVTLVVPGGQVIRYRIYAQSYSIIATYQERVYYQSALTDGQLVDVGDIPAWIQTTGCD